MQLWDVENDESVTIGNRGDEVTSVVFSPPDGNHIAWGSSDEKICIWNVERRELAVGPLARQKSSVYVVVYSHGRKKAHIWFA